MKSLEPEVAFWENHECKTPPRTRLCRLTPLGLGSGLIESLTSLIHRLAGAHSLATRHLVVREIVPLWRHQTVYWRDGRCDLLGKFGASLNGNNDSAAEMTSLMEMLTGLSHLDSLTMRPCGHHIAPRPLIRVRQAWCPACFRKWREEGEELYYPLIWSVLAVRVCPVHGEPLHDICSACGKH